jgi:hypothetical protein
MAADGIFPEKKKIKNKIKIKSMKEAKTGGYEKKSRVDIFVVCVLFCFFRHPTLGSFLEQKEVDGYG